MVWSFFWSQVACESPFSPVYVEFFYSERLLCKRGVVASGIKIAESYLLLLILMFSSLPFVWEWTFSLKMIAFFLRFFASMCE